MEPGSFHWCLAQEQSPGFPLEHGRFSLHAWEPFFPAGVTEPRHRLSGKVLESPTLEMLKGRLAMALGRWHRWPCLSRGLGPVTSRGPFRPQPRCGSVSISRGSFLPLFHHPYLNPRVFSCFCPSNSCPHPTEGGRAAAGTSPARQGRSPRRGCSLRRSRAGARAKREAPLCRDPAPCAPRGLAEGTPCDLQQ